MEEFDKMPKELVQLSRLALEGSRKDVEMYLKRLVRKLKRWSPQAAEELVEILSRMPRRTAAVRSAEMDSIPVDRDSRLNLLRVDKNPTLENDLVLAPNVFFELNEVLEERKKEKELLIAGVEPSKAVLFVGPPGVGKSLSAKYIAKLLDLPLLTLDLSSVMSSFLGRTGSNIRNIFDFAKTSRCVLFLDEIDSIAKKRDDSTEVGELKRLVTVLLQELDNWPSDNLIIAATNHDELLDPAVWRRFDRVVKFPPPTTKDILKLLHQELEASGGLAQELLHVLSIIFKDQSQADILRKIRNLKKTAVLSGKSIEDVLQAFLNEAIQGLTHENRLSIAEALYTSGMASQRKASELTGISRDTIRKKSNVKI